ncbi:MAG: ribonuclease PH [Planctomycetales bacterium]
MRQDRRPDQLRPIRIQRNFTGSTPGSVLIQAGKTTILCTVSVQEGLPEWMGNSQKGWVTSEYSMLPGSTAPRKTRDRGGKIDGRTTEIQRLIGRSLRAVVDREALGPRSLYVDCDVLEADGGTRTLSITGGFIALCDAIHALAPVLPQLGRPVFTSSIAAVSVGYMDGQLLLDLQYSEDSKAEVDLNVVMTGAGEFVEIQGTAEGRTFSRLQLDAQLALAEQGIRDLTRLQQEALGDAWPFK